jgi:ribosomal protein L35AE/L33A
MQKLKINEIHLNDENPRQIKSARFSKLVKSIKDFPEMLKLRPIVINDDNVIIGGNMRYRACKQLGHEEVYVVKAEELTKEQETQFILKDNVTFGDWDVDVLGNQFEKQYLLDQGMDSSMLGFFNNNFESDMLKAEAETTELPIVPQFSEKYSCVMIFCDNELDETWIRNALKLGKAKDYKTERIKETSVMSVEKFQELWENK